MKELSKIEKEKHHSALKMFIDSFINGVLFLNKKMALEHVSYIVPIDNVFFYFDFPFKFPMVDDFNRDLKLEYNELNEVNRIIFQAFSQSKNNDGKFNGYIHYKYSVDDDNSTYLLSSAMTNLELEEPIKKKYLRVIDSTVHPSYRYKYVNIESADTGNNTINLLTLYQPIKSISDTSFTTGLSCSFLINDDSLVLEKQDEPLVINLYDKIVYLIKTYFESPVLEKILSEQRKSEVLAYHHSIDGLELDSYVILLRNEMAGQSESLQKLFKDFEKRFEVLRLLHYSLFKTEYIHSGIDGANTGRNFPLTNKTVSEIIQNLIDDYNYNEKKIHFTKHSGVDKVDFKPKTGSVNDPDPELYDIILVIWNVWQNAISASEANSSEDIWITAKPVENKLAISFKNKGEIRQEYLDYINGLRNDYPIFDSNPNKKFRGLEIIKEKCSNKSRMWRFNVEISKEKDKNIYTTIHLVF